MARIPWNKGLKKDTDQRVAKYSLKLKGMKKPWQENENHHNWKGDKIGYFALHSWVTRKLGKPSKCEHCGDTSERKYHWANISKMYKRDLSDWVRLCIPCHMKFDDSVFGKINLGRPAPWARNNPQVFKKGQRPHNKKQV